MLRLAVEVLARFWTLVDLGMIDRQAPLRQLHSKQNMLATADLPIWEILGEDGNVG